MKYTVEQYTVEKVKSEGGRRYLKRNSKRILLLLALSIGWIPSSLIMVKGNPEFDNYNTIIKVFIYLAPVVLIWGNLILGYYQACRNFLRRYKEDSEIMK